jgi:hypothetical protein
MRKLLLRALFFLIPFLYSIYVSSQPQKEKDCSTTCFSTEVVSANRLSGTCTAYEMKVSFSGECSHALSHFTVAVPCGVVQNLWNSQNWAQVIGTDPTTGLKGFKIDNITGFGEGDETFFTVKFNLCSTSENCEDQLGCWQPTVAYKASTCVDYETLTVSCKSLKASLQKQDASCFGASDGSLSVLIESGQEPYSIIWADNATNASRTGLSAGAYSVVIRDAADAEVTLEETIEQPEQIILSGSSTPASCNGSADGAIDLTASGGAGVYTYFWNNGAETEDLQSLPAGQYTVIVKDASNCASTAKFTITNTSGINISSTHIKTDCNAATGSIDISVTGGEMPYTYNWMDGATTEDRGNLKAGLYTVVVSDKNGCSEKAAIFIRDNNTLVLRATTTSSTCSDETSGSVNLTVSGGTSPYTYLWSNGATTEDLSGITSGYYTVVVTDSKGCTATSGFTVSKTVFQVPKIVVQPTCHGDANGSITIQEPIGGTGPFTYVWSHGATGMELTGLTAGTYSVTVTDASGCSRVVTATITDPPQINASASISNLQCGTDGPFSVDLTVSGGSSPYTFQWSNGSTSEDLEGIENGSYTVAITDSHGCSVVKEIVVEGQPAAWSCHISALPVMPLCSSQGNVISTSIQGAHSYLWSIQSTDGSWSILSGADLPSLTFIAGGQGTSATFTLTVSKDGCTQTCSYTVSTCQPQDNGGGTDPGGEDPGEEPGEEPGDDGDNQSCEECLNTVARIIEESGTCRTYEMVVNTNGFCRHDLSHWTLAIPCGSVTDYSNSEGWTMVLGKDPTTGLYGLKVDGINYFGKEESSFTVRFTVCENNDCNLTDWNAGVAYKAGQCVAFESVEIEASAFTTMVSVYPNPFNDQIHFEWSIKKENVKLDIIDQYGNPVSAATQFTNGAGGYNITLESSSLPKGMYYYRLTMDGKMYTGKITKR